MSEQVFETHARRQEDKPPPHNLDAEKAVLGALIVSQDVWPAVASVLKPADFYRPAHQTIYQRMLGLLERGLPIDFVLLKDDLVRFNELNDIGGPAYIASLTSGMPHEVNAGYYAGIVRETARLRAVIRIAAKISEAAYEREASAADVMEIGVAGLLGVAEAGNATVTSATDAVREYVGMQDEPAEKHAPITCGYRDLDAMIGGWQRGQLVIVAARTSVGKSSFSLGACDAMARAGFPNAFVSLEMSRQSLAAQLVAWRSKVPAERVRRRQATEQDYRRIGDAWIAIDGLPVYFVESARTLTQVAAWARRLRDQQNIACVVVDYLQRLSHDMGDRRGGGGGDRRRLEVASVSLGLKRIAMDLNIVVIALSQLSRAPEGRSDKRPLLSDLRESGDIEQDADVAILLFREEMHKKVDTDQEGITETIVAKNRSGPVGTQKLYFDKGLAQFRDIIL